MLDLCDVNVWNGCVTGLSVTSISASGRALCNSYRYSIKVKPSFIIYTLFICCCFFSEFLTIKLFDYIYLFIFY